MEKHKGRVKWFNDAKGFGFLVREGVAEDEEKGKGIFVHYSSIEMDGRKTLVENQLVEFSLAKTDKGYKAMQVTPLA